MAPIARHGYQYKVLRDQNGLQVLYEHREEAARKYGDLPEGFVVHHIDGNKLNNRWSNLILIHRKDHFRIHVKKDLEVKNTQANNSRFFFKIPRI